MLLTNFITASVIPALYFAILQVTHIFCICMCYLQVNKSYARFPVVGMPLEEVQLSQSNSVMPCAFSNFLGLILYNSLY